MDKSQSYVAHRRKADGALQTLKEHLYGVATISSDAGKKIGLPTCAKLIGLLHDIGKYSRAFQNRISDDPEIDSDERVDHSTAGSQILWRELSSKGKIGPIVAQLLSVCVASHHGGLIDCLSPEGEDNFQRRIDKVDTHCARLLRMLTRIFGDEYAKRLTILLSFMNLKQK